MTTTARSNYIRFLSLSSDITLPCDATAQKLLDIIATCDEYPLTVTEAMSMVDVASPATIHRKLDDLREAGLIEQTYKPGNRRTKYLVPTSKAHKHFAKLSEAMDQAVRGGS